MEKRRWEDRWLEWNKKKMWDGEKRSRERRARGMKERKKEKTGKDR